MRGGIRNRRIVREKWANILLLYNRLLMVDYSPVAALNRAYAFARVYGKEAAIPEAEGLKLEGNLFYHSLLGELYTGVDADAAIGHLELGLELALDRRGAGGIAGEDRILPEELAGLFKGGLDNPVMATAQVKKYDAQKEAEPGGLDGALRSKIAARP